MESLGWLVLRIEDGGRQLGGGKFIRMAQPFDFIAIKNERCLFFDAKFRGTGKTVTASMLSLGESCKRQVEVLSRIEGHGHKAGFVVCLGAVGEVWWVPVAGIKEPQSHAVLWSRFSSGLPLDIRV